MNMYLADTKVTLPISFKDDNGNEIENIISASYVVYDENSNIIIDKTDFDISEDKLIVEAKYNHLEQIDIDNITSENKFDISIFGVRSIEFELIDENDNVIPYFIRYIIYPKERLIVGLNSFQDSKEANLNVISISDIDGWLQATENQRTTAMMEAYFKICSFEFDDNCGYGVIENLGDLVKSDYEKFSPQFKKALKMAQVAFATESSLSENGNSSRIDDGIVIQKIGETMETYRDTVPLKSKLSKTAMSYLNRFIVLNKKIARA